MIYIRNKFRFTLVELLIVIAIIAILAGLFLPALITAKQTALKIACMGNMRQIDTGFQNYRESYKDYFPLAFTYPTPSVDLWWSSVISVNVQEHPSAYRCPADKNKTPGKYMYGINSILTSRGYPAAPYIYTPPLRISNVRKTSRTFMITDGRNLYGLIERLERTDPAYASHSVENRHLAGMNLLYVDGHAAWQKPVSGLGFTSSQIAMRDPNTLYE